MLRLSEILSSFFFGIRSGGYYLPELYAPRYYCHGLEEQQSARSTKDTPSYPARFFGAKKAI